MVGIVDEVPDSVKSWLVPYLESCGINALTDIQRSALNAGVADGKSMIVGAPTSSGKTLIGEIAIMVAIRNGFRALYLVSHKALADQKFEELVARFSDQRGDPTVSVGLNTGDRSEGDFGAIVLIATYESALGLILAGTIKPQQTVVVADELQILNDENRGHDVEVLCTILKQRRVRGFLGLTATLDNLEDIAGWLDCELVTSNERSIPLQQEIWYQGKVWRTKFGQEEGVEISELARRKAETVLDVVQQNLELGRQPILVFTETKKQATELARQFASIRQRTGKGIEISQQLELFSEPTDLSESLRENAERRVAFHTADLSTLERQVLEKGFAQSTFDVCFATSTLAAGVNFPFRTVIIGDLTYRYRSTPPRITRSDYRNMSGRAGRLGFHEEGFSLLLPQNSQELAYARSLVGTENDRVRSKLVDRSLRKTVLSLFAARLVTSTVELEELFTKTLLWYQTLDRNPDFIARLQKDCIGATEWLLSNQLLQQDGSHILVSELGKISSLTGLLPSTCVKLATFFTEHRAGIETSFSEYESTFVYLACGCDEFCGSAPTRYLPFTSALSSISESYLRSRKIQVPLESANQQLLQVVHAIDLFRSGEEERKISFQAKVPAGAIPKVAADVAWVLDGFWRLSSTKSLGLAQSVSNSLAQLSRKVRWGVTADCLDLLRIATKGQVPGFGRQRVMALRASGLASIEKILDTELTLLAKVLGNERRARDLLEVVSGAVGHNSDRLRKGQVLLAKALNVDELVERCNASNGTAYESAVVDLLRMETSWVITVLDDGTRQNVPDIQIEFGGQSVLLECKTCTKSPPQIKKEEAWAVLQKAADFDNQMRRVTLGKPEFDETCKAKVVAARDITLVEHEVFIEAVLRVLCGELTAEAFIEWISAPGLAEFDRIGGRASYQIS